MSAFAYSMVVLARKECALLAKQLSVLAPAARRGECEIVVAAADGAGGARSIVEEFNQSCSAGVRLVCQNGAGPAKARNLGAVQSTASLLLFLDDVTEPDPEFVRLHLERYRPGSVVLGYPAPAAPRSPDLRRARQYLQRSDAYRECRRQDHRFRYRDFEGSSMLLAAELFHRAGGFDSEPEPLELAELGLRLLKSGVRPLGIGEPTGRRHEETVPSWWLRARAEGKADIRIGDRHPEMRHELWRLAAPANRRGVVLRNRAFARDTLFQGALLARLRWCEGLRLRTRFSPAFLAVREFSYAAGVADATGSWRNFQAWLQDGSSPPAVAPDAPVIAVDDAEAYRGADQPAPVNGEQGARVAVRGIEIGAIAPLAGAEPLRWPHLLRWVEETLENPAARFAAPVRDRSGYWPAAQFSIELNALNRSLYVDPRYARLDLLVCSGGRPLASVSIPCETGDRLLSPERLRREVVSRAGWDACRDVSAAAAGHAEVVKEPPISVVVCTRDRPASLRRCLRYLSQLSYPAFEVVVVDNASRSSEVRQIVLESGFRYVREDRPGLDWARNRGVDEARHEIIAYTDDDACVSTGWLHGIARAFDDPRVSAVTGLVLPLELETMPQALFEEYGGMGRGLLPRAVDSSRAPEFDIAAASPFGAGVNMAFRREVLEQMGRFDTALDVGTPSRGGGDLDMFHRIVASGRLLVYEPAAWVRHCHRRDLNGLERQLNSNARAFPVHLIKIWKSRTARRATCARVALWWTTGWLLGRLVKRLRGRSDFPLSLILAEIRGTLQGPYAYRETYRRDRELRSVGERPGNASGAEAPGSTA